MPVNLTRARALGERYNTGTCDLLSLTTVAGGKGGSRSTYTTTASNEPCRIVADKQVSEILIGDRLESVVTFTIHLRHDLAIKPSQIIRSGGVDYEVLADVSDPTNRYATLAKCRRLT